MQSQPISSLLPRNSMEKLRTFGAVVHIRNGSLPHKLGPLVLYLPGRFLKQRDDSFRKVQHFVMFVRLCFLQMSGQIVSKYGFWLMILWLFDSQDTLLIQQICKMKWSSNLSWSILWYSTGIRLECSRKIAMILIRILGSSAETRTRYRPTSVGLLPLLHRS